MARFCPTAGVAFDEDAIDLQMVRHLCQRRLRVIAQRDDVSGAAGVGAKRHAYDPVVARPRDGRECRKLIRRSDRRQGAR